MQRAGLAILACSMLVAAGCGSDDDAAPDRFTAIPKRTVQAPADQTAPRWQRLATLGVGDRRRVD
ncbi:MAG: hypothetical protein ACRDMZ_15290, partial [Solirubrobacteraceae bacterium]